MEHMIDVLLKWDESLLLLINGAHAQWLDAVMIFCSGKFTWLPLYVLLLFYVWYRLGGVHVLFFLLGVALAVLLADQVSVHCFKNVFERLRPCHELALAGRLHLPTNHCGGQYGFVSSHACNVFAVWYVVCKFLQQRGWWWCLLLWALVVGYSRVYLGVHYPGDVLGGAVVGWLMGVLAFFVVCRLYRWCVRRGWLPRRRSPLARDSRRYSRVVWG